jgi:hypothetical protein
MPPSDKAKTRIGLLGVRDFKNRVYSNQEYITERMDEFLRRYDLTPATIELVTGGGKGVEALALAWALKNEIPSQCIPPNIQEYGAETAFAIRNNHVVSDCELLVIFWDGCIKITQEAIVNAMHRGRVVTVYPLR